MKNDFTKKGWKVISEFEHIDSKWLTIIGEKLLDDSKKELEYWRVEKPNGMIVIVLQNNNFILPKKCTDQA